MLLLLSLVVFFIQQSPLLVIMGSRPNLLLMVGMMVVTLDKGWGTLLSMLGIIVGAAFIAEPFWIIPISMCAGVILLGRGIRNQLTGNAWIDYCVLVLGGEIILMSILWMRMGVMPSYMQWAWELSYTGIVGIIVWGIGTALRRVTFR
jgi:hypothetical protein